MSLYSIIGVFLLPPLAAHKLLIKKKKVFVLGCSGSSLLQELPPSCDAQAFHCGGFSLGPRA